MKTLLDIQAKHLSRAKESYEEFNRSDVYKRVGKQLRDELWSAMQGMELLSEEYCFICDSVLQAVDLVAWVVATAGRFPSPARSQLVSWFAMEQMLAMQCCIAGVSAATQPGEVSQMSSTAQPLFLDQQLYSFSDAWESSEIPYSWGKNEHVSICTSVANIEGFFVCFNANDVRIGSRLQ